MRLLNLLAGASLMATANSTVIPVILENTDSNDIVLHDIVSEKVVKKVDLYNEDLEFTDFYHGFGYEDEKEAFEDVDFIYTNEQEILIKMSDKQEEMLTNNKLYNKKIKVKFQGKIVNSRTTATFERELIFTSKFVPTWTGKKQIVENSDLNIPIKYNVDFEDSKTFNTKDGIFLSPKMNLKGDFDSFYKGILPDRTNTNEIIAINYFFSEITIEAQQDIYDLSVLPLENIDFIFDPNQDKNIIDKSKIKTKLEEIIEEKYSILPNDFIDYEKTIDQFKPEVINPSINDTSYEMKIYINPKYKTLNQFYALIRYKKEIDLNKIKSREIDLDSDELENFLNEHYLKIKDVEGIHIEEKEIVIIGDGITTFNKLTLTIKQKEENDNGNEDENGSGNENENNEGGNENNEGENENNEGGNENNEGENENNEGGNENNEEENENNEGENENNEGNNEDEQGDDNSGLGGENNENGESEEENNNENNSKPEGDENNLNNDQNSEKNNKKMNSNLYYLLLIPGSVLLLILIQYIYKIFKKSKTKMVK